MGELNNLLESISKLAGEMGITVEDLKQRLIVLISNTEVKEDKTTTDKLNELIENITFVMDFSDFEFDFDKHMMFIYNDLGTISESIRSKWDGTCDDKIFKDSLLNKLGDLVWNCLVLNMHTDEYSNVDILATIVNNQFKVPDTSLYAVRRSMYKIQRKHIMEVMNLVYSLGFTFDDVYEELLECLELCLEMKNEGR